MPRFDEARDELVAALLGRGGGPSPAAPANREAELDPFRKLARAALGLIAEPRLAGSAFAALDAAGLLEPAALAGAGAAELEETLRQGGVRLAAKSLGPLVKLARWADEAGFDADREAAAGTDSLREAWRATRGLGPATIDSILLHGLGRAAYPVDRATYRILARHGWLDPSADYDEARSLAEAMAPDDPDRLAELSSAMVRLGRDFCKPAVAHCDRCPLRPLLPEGGPVGLE